MASEPYLRPAGDGTFELLVPSAGGAVHVLPYCFHTEEDAANWLASRKGRELIRKVRSRYRAKPISKRCALPTGAAVSWIPAAFRDGDAPCVGRRLNRRSLR